MIAYRLSGDGGLLADCPGGRAAQIGWKLTHSFLVALRVALDPDCKWFSGKEIRPRLVRRNGTTSSLPSWQSYSPPHGLRRRFAG